MPKFRSLYETDVHVPYLGAGRIVKPGEVVDVPEDLAGSFEVSVEGWEPVVILGSSVKKNEEN